MIKEDTDWISEKFSIQRWLKNTAWRNLYNTRFGIAEDCLPCYSGLYDDPLLFQVYKIDVGLFLSTEKVAMEHVSAMVGFSPDEATSIALSQQTLDEARHYEVFEHRLRDFSMSKEQVSSLRESVVTPSMRSFFDLIGEQTDKKDFANSMLAIQVVLEGMAIPIYQYEIKYWQRFDPALSQIIALALSDEAKHIGFGEVRLRRMIESDTALRNKVNTNIRSYSSLMSDIFKEIIHHYVGLYQECANEHMALVGDIEIFPNRKISQLSEEEQVSLLLHNINNEQKKRMAKLGLEFN